jgi:PAS domain S-box-containing protein
LQGSADTPVALHLLAWFLHGGAGFAFDVEMQSAALAARWAAPSLQHPHEFVIAHSMPTSTPSSPDLLLLFPGAGEMAQRCRAFAWELTSLGPTSGWSTALRAIVRTVLESPFPMNVWCGPQFALIYNDAYRQVLGASHPESLGRSGAEVWAEIWSEFAPVLEAVAAGEVAQFTEGARFLVKREPGALAEAFFTYSLSPVRDDDGAVIAVLNVALETTERVLTDRELRSARLAAEQAEARLRDVFTQAPAFLAVLRGTDHVYEFVNDAYWEIVGRRELIGRRVREAMPELVEQGFVKLLDAVLQTGVPHVGRSTPVVLHGRGDGQSRPMYLDFIYQPLTDGTGARTGVVAFGSNVTDAVESRREIEWLLRESERARAEAEFSEARYRFLAGAIPVHVWSATPDGSLDFVSDRTREYLGLPAEAIPGSDWTTVLHPDDVERSKERWRHSLQSGEPYEIEFRLWSAKDQAYRWHLVRASAQRDDGGTIVRWFGTNTDIEDWKVTQTELQRLTIEAQDANRSKSDFLAAMSHELRTPLNAIGGYAQLLELGVRGPVTDEQKTDLRRIQRSKAHLDGLVSGVLDFAKGGAGHMELRIVTLDVGTMITSVLDMVLPQVNEKGLTLAPITVPERLTVQGDVDKTRQILLNLLANALKFTHRGGTVRVEVEARPGEVLMHVSDTGIGIAPELQERIFEPFVQAKTALHVAGIGVGLGLAISRQLARAMHGDVSVSSVPGEGSTFTLTLPSAG